MTPETDFLLEAYGPASLQRYGLGTDQVSEERYNALRQAAARFKTNKQGAVMRGLLRLTQHATPAQQSQALAAATTLAALAQYGYDGSPLVLAATSAEALASAARAQAEKFGKKDAVQQAQEFSVNDTPPDWTDGRYRVYAAKSENDCIRFGQDQRYDFCVSRLHNNFYHDYRAKHQATYYFVYDTALSPYDKKHVAVLAVGADGHFEVTFANNAQDYDTRQYRNNLDKFLASKPGLDAARDLFQPEPLADEERADVDAARGAQSLGNPDGRPFDQLTPAQQLTFVRLGHSLSDEQYAQAPAAVRDVYIARVNPLTDAQAGASTEAQRKRAAQLFWRVNKTDKPAAWLAAYPEGTAGEGPKTHRKSQWPPSNPEAVATWFGSPKPAITPLMECACEPGQDQNLTTPAGDAYSGRRLAHVLGEKPERAVSLRELSWDADDPDKSPVVVGQLREGLRVLAGAGTVQALHESGALDVPARVATRQDLDYARQGSAQTLLEHALAVHGAAFDRYATALLQEANQPLPEAVLLAGAPSQRRGYVVRLLEEGFRLDPATVGRLDELTQRRYYERALQLGQPVDFAYGVHRAARQAGLA